MAQEIYHTESVIEGQYAKWCYDGYTPGTKPTKPGYLLNGWEYEGTVYDPDIVSESPFGAITEPAKVYYKWSGSEYEEIEFIEYVGENLPTTDEGEFIEYNGDTYQWNGTQYESLDLSSVDEIDDYPPATSSGNIIKARGRVKIYAVWGKIVLEANANKGIGENKISADGDDDVKLYYYGKTLGPCPKSFADDIDFEVIPLNQGQQTPINSNNPIDPTPTTMAIQFQTSPVSVAGEVEQVSNGTKNVKHVIVLENTNIADREYKFRAIPKVGGAYEGYEPSETITIVQKHHVYVFTYNDGTTEKVLNISVDNNFNITQVDEANGNSKMLRIISTKDEEYFSDIVFNGNSELISSEGPLQEGVNIAKFNLVFNKCNNASTIKVVGNNFTMDNILNYKTTFVQNVSNKRLNLTCNYTFPNNKIQHTIATNNNSGSNITIKSIILTLAKNTSVSTDAFTFNFEFETNRTINDSVQVSFILDILKVFENFVVINLKYIKSDNTENSFYIKDSNNQLFEIGTGPNQRTFNIVANGENNIYFSN